MNFRNYDPLGAKRSLTPLEAHISKQLGEVVENRVRRTCTQWNQKIRERLRNSTGFRLKHKQEVHRVPVDVVAGFPEPFRKLLEDQGSQIDLWVSDTRNRLSSAARTLADVKDHILSIQSEIYFDRELPASTDEITNVGKLLDEIGRWKKDDDWLGKIRELNQDLLGAYFYRTPKIEIYWMAIGIVAKRLDIQVEDLTFVVLTHELAHAYSHLGFDIDGDFWPTNFFDKTELHIVEGLAQFYTKAVCTGLQDEYPSFMQAFIALARIQHDAYTHFGTWASNHSRIGEVVRLAMIDCRTQKMTTYNNFLDNIQNVEMGFEDDLGRPKETRSLFE
jgi:hypothetical protein